MDVIEGFYCIILVVSTLVCPPQGYLIVPKYFEKGELDACREDIKVLVDDLADSLFKAGKIKGTHMHAHTHTHTHYMQTHTYTQGYTHIHTSKS